jgi:glutamate-1-semialdehyde 2,1-aminomutase
MQASDMWARALKVLPGGVNSPVRAFGSVGGTPLFIKSAKGAFLTDTEGREYVDFLGAWGPMILGHNHPEINAAIMAKLKDGISFGACTQEEVLFAEEICAMVPAIEMLRMVNSGTEATLSAVRVARGYTGKEKIIKFRGCYHGHGDQFLIAAGSGALTHGVPNSAGVTAGAARDTLLADYNNIQSVRQLFEQNNNQIAAVIIEPVPGNMGLVLPKKGFLEDLRALCTQTQAVLIFDEVMTGFRLAPGGAQELFNITPDLCTLGKIIGGGLPVGAYGGRREIMEQVSPTGPVYQAGTLSGNPVAVAAGRAQLKLLNQIKPWQNLDTLTTNLAAELRSLAQSHGLPIVVNQLGSMFTLFFSSEAVVDYESALKSDSKKYAKFFHEMLAQGVYLAPSQFESLFVSNCHDQKVIEQVLTATDRAMGMI